MPGSRLMAALISALAKGWESHDDGRETTCVKQRIFWVLAIATASLLRAGSFFHFASSFCLLKGYISCYGVVSDRNSLILPYLYPSYREVAEKVSLTFFNMKLLVLMTCLHSLQIFCHQDNHLCHVENMDPLWKLAGFTITSELSLLTPLLSTVILYLWSNIKPERG